MSAARVEYLVVRHPSQPSAGLVGEGALDVDAVGVHIQGARPQTALPTVVGIFAGLFLAIVYAVVLVSLDVEVGGRGGLKAVGVGGAVISLGGGFLIADLLRKKLPKKQVDARVAWSNVQVVGAKPGLVHLRLSDPALRGDVLVRASDPASSAALESAFGGKP